MAPRSPAGNEHLSPALGAVASAAPNRHGYRGPVPGSVVAFFLGGTISMAGHDGPGAVVRRSGAELLSGVPQLRSLDVAVEARQFRALPSAALRFDDVSELVAAAEGLDVDGVVVVQGTDTIEESAYLIDLLWSSDTPVVVTGAMRNPTLAGADGPANLLAAVAVAASPSFRGMGALVVLADQVHAARFARKVHTTSVAAFASPNAGPVGLVAEGSAHRLLGLERAPTYRITPPLTARVPLLALGVDDGGELLDGADSRLDGLVVAGFGGGHVPPALAERLGSLAARVPVVLASRAGSGRVLERTYGAVGAEIDLLDRGLVSAGWLDAAKARVLLRVLLAAGVERAGVQEAFAAAI